MKVLVTGASGFVGKSIVAELSKKDLEVFGLVSPRTKNDAGNSFQADIGNFETLECVDQLKDIDVVIHSAGLAHQFGETDESDFWKINVEGTKNVTLVAARLKAQHFILISSVAVYGGARGRHVAIDEDFPCEPEGDYARSKFEAEKAAREICESNLIPLTILRLATVIGEGDRGNTSRLVRLIDRGRFLWIGKGENRKSLVYKNDAARACAAVLDKKTNKTEVFNVTAAPISMKEIVSEIARRLNKKIRRINVPPKLLEIIFKVNEKSFRSKRVYRLAETVRKWLSDDVFAGEKIASEYGFRPEMPISEALGRQVESYKSQK